MRRDSLIDALHYGGLLLAGVLLAALLAMRLTSTSVTAGERAGVLAAGLIAYAALALGFAAAWPDTTRGDGILLATPGIALAAILAANTVVDPSAVDGSAQGLTTIAVAVVVMVAGTWIGSTVGKAIGRRGR